MDDLVLVSKVNGAAGLRGARSGRPARTNFCLRRYGNSYVLAIPNGTVVDGDNVDFYVSQSGFAIKISPDGERSISGKKSARTASVPKEVAKRMADVPVGVTNLVSEDRSDRLWFFPFSQFSKA